MANPAIPSSQPTITSSTAALTFDHWWITGIQINGDDPANVWAVVTMRQCYFDANAMAVMSDAAKTVKFALADLMNDPDPAVQAATINLIQAVINKASALNLL